MFLRFTLALALTIAISQLVLRPASAAPVTLTEQGWTVSADADMKVLSVRHQRTGFLLEDVRLRLHGPKGLQAAAKWSVSAVPHRLSIVTEAPRTQWTIEPAGDLLKIVSTSSDAVVTARVPVTKDRFAARLLEKGGTPVVWSGTDEVVGTYGFGYFNGQDVYNNWHGMHTMIDSINANAFLNHIVVYVMPGEGMELGPRMTVDQASRVRPPVVINTARQREEPLIGFGLTAAEARTVVSFTSLTGVAYALASVLPELPEERVRLIKQTLPTLPILPADLFSRGSTVQWATFKQVRADDYVHHFPEILDLKINAAAGVYDVVGLTNWRQAKVTRQLSFSEKLGLDPSARYVVFDFWNQRLLGVFKDHMEVDIEPHDTRVLHVHPLLAQPQLIGMSRHISGAYSVLELKWDEAKRTLRGTSQTVPGDAYVLYVYVPDGLAVAKVDGRAGQGGAVPARWQRSGDCLTIRLAGQKQPIQWEAAFVAGAR